MLIVFISLFAFRLSIFLPSKRHLQGSLFLAHLCLHFLCIDVVAAKVSPGVAVLGTEPARIEATRNGVR